MNLSNIINVWDIDKNTIALTDSPAFSHYEKATNVNFEIKSRVYIENPYKDVLSNKMMISVDIRDASDKSSIYLTYNRLTGFITDLKNVLKENLYSPTSGWFIKQQNHIQLNDSVPLTSVKIPIADGKDISIKPWKSAANAEPSLILSIDNNNKHTTVDLPVYLFEIMVQKLCELKASFEVIRITLVNQFIMSKILNNAVCIPTTKSPKNEYVPPPIEPYIATPLSQNGTTAGAIVPTTNTVDNGPINHKTSISTIEGSVNPLTENFNILFDGTKDSIDEPVINIDNMFNDLTETEATPEPVKQTTQFIDLNLFENTTIQSEFLKIESKLDLVLSQFMVAHTSNCSLKDPIYSSMYDNINKTNEIKLYIDNLLKPIDKSNPDVNHLLTKLRDIKIFPCYDNNWVYTETKLYNLTEKIILGLYTAILRTSLIKGVTDNQVLFRTFITLNYETILVYMLSIHYNYLEITRNSGLLKTVVSNIIRTYKSKQIYITDKLNKLISQYTSNEIKLDSLFDHETIYTLLDKVLSNIPSEPITKPTKESISSVNINNTTSEQKDNSYIQPQKQEIMGEPDFSDIPNITLLLKKMIPDDNTRKIVNDALMLCKKSIAQIIDVPNLEEVLNRIDGVPLILKILIMEWSPMGNIYHKDLKRFKNYCRDKNSEILKYNTEQERELDLAVSLKISSLMSINKMIDANHSTFEKLLKDYDYYRNVENLYDDVKQQITKITTNPFTTGIIIEYYISKR